MKSNRIVTLGLLALALLISVPSIFAQELVRAKVPFDFKVGNTAMPAGSYTISSVSQSAISISNRQEHAGVLAVVRSEYANKDQSPKLVFHKYGDQYFLAQIWTGSGNAGKQLPESKLEKELLASNHGAIAEEEIVIALN